MSDLSNKQEDIITEIKKQLSYWENTNDIESPTHVSDINEEVDKNELLDEPERFELKLRLNEILSFVKRAS